MPETDIVHAETAYASIAVLTAVLLAAWAAGRFLLARALTPKVFISYRRNDTRAMANRLCVDLKERFGDTNVFMDTQDVPYGRPYQGVLAGWLAWSDAIVSLVGPNWDGGEGEDIKKYPRILNEFDWVRHEVEYGLARRRLLICPVLTTTTDQEPAIPKYTIDQLVAWDRVQQAKLLDELDQEKRLPRLPLVEDAGGYKSCREALCQQINRLHVGSLYWLLRQAWTWLMPVVIAAFTILAWYWVRSTDATTRDLERRLIKEIEQRDPALILPYSLERFAAVVTKDPEQAAKTLKGSYVVWQARFVKSDPPVDGSTLVELRPASDLKFKVRAAVSNRALERLPAQARAVDSSVWVIGVVQDCSQYGADVMDARIVPDIPDNE